MQLTPLAAVAVSPVLTVAVVAAVAAGFLLPNVGLWTSCGSNTRVVPEEFFKLRRRRRRLSRSRLEQGSLSLV